MIFVEKNVAEIDEEIKALKDNLSKAPPSVQVGFNGALLVLNWLKDGGKRPSSKLCGRV